MVLAGRVLPGSAEDGVGCWGASRREAPRGRGDGGAGTAAGAPGAAQLCRDALLAAAQSGALGRIYGERCQPRLRVGLCRLVFGLSLFFPRFIPGPVGLAEFAGCGRGSRNLCSCRDAV